MISLIWTTIKLCPAIQIFPHYISVLRKIYNSSSIFSSSLPICSKVYSEFYIRIGIDAHCFHPQQSIKCQAPLAVMPFVTQQVHLYGQ